MVKQGKENVVCDECGANFKISRIKQKNVRISNTNFTLTYFACPLCNKVYVVSLQDNKLRKLIDDVKLAQFMVKQTKGKMDTKATQRAITRAEQIKKEATEYHTTLLSKYPGTFYERFGAIMYKEQKR